MALVKVNRYAVQVKYSGRFEDYTINDFTEKAYVKIGTGVDAFDHQDFVTEEIASKYERIFLVENTFPCNNIATVRWFIKDLNEEGEV